MKILLFANTDWYLYNFRLALAKAIRAQGHEIVLLSPPGKYSERLKQAGFRWIPLPLERRRLNPLAELITILRIAQVYHKERPDLVHHFTVKCVLYGSIAARLARIKAVVNALAGLGHIFSDDGFRAKALKQIVKSICKLTLRPSEVIFQNPDDHSAFLKLGLVYEETSHLIRGSGVDVERFKPRASEPAGGGRYVLLASRLLWAKGVSEYVEAARLVRQWLPETVFLLAGETDPGNPSAIPQSVIDKWQGDVEVLGHCEDMRALIENVDLVALPTYYGEGVPRILIEAAATGKPLVATDMPGCREIVRHGVNGSLVPAHDSEQLARAIRDILIDDERREEMGRCSRHLACSDFSEDQVISKTFQVYQKCLPAGRAVGRDAWLGADPTERKEIIPA
ncbi:MAG TPA: glycosyltransferase family 4 protein [Blastocatellia bacterium]|jgi:glycosyltransferase involved in cell wall biosynthesis